MAPHSTIEHHESWTITIMPGDGDEPWPVTASFTGRAPVQPDVITVTVRPGQKPAIRGSGLRLRQAGTPGSVRQGLPWYALRQVPDWARDVAREALREHGFAGTAEELP